MPSTTLQTRISAFESPALYNSRPPPSPSPSPPNLGRKTSLIDLKDWVVDDGPRVTKTPTQQAFKGPLISFESSPPKPKPKPKPTNLSAASFKPPPKLPPRKPSHTSLKSVASSSADSLTVEHAHRYPPLALDLSPRNHAPSSSISSFHSVSLSSDTDPSTPGSVANFIATFPMDEEHHATGRDTDSISLTDSYEDVSTSSLASPATERLITLDWEKAMAKRKQVPPKLPQRPSSARSPILKPTPPPSSYVSRAASASGSTPASPIVRPTISAASSSSTLAQMANNGNIPTPYVPRRAAPPPPPSRSSDRSSIRSNTSYSSSSHSHQSQVAHRSSLLSLKTKRPTPVPLAARKRYEVVFNANVLQRRRAEKQRQEEKPMLLSPVEARGRRAAGWRGLSVDLITGDDAHPQSPMNGDQADETVRSDEKLEGSIVKLIWKRSGLESAQLADIWNECDVTGKGALSFDAFVKGMWRIDEELRRAQTQAIKSATAYRSNNLRTAPKIPQKSRDILC
ncbi:hypothetical protein GALMADRAFT_221573 [Galerina marginata CBS 339.88]|uniref:EH domain-containing protein n=1 Tax=Galerina marginata (strain CBS 339.88) TaxID=685588 RepID=A0A067TH71_GALM3|nr:hypothetical protein GALMADRAFT_221573 [Galerina marginata CBS 339.88]